MTLSDQDGSYKERVEEALRMLSAAVALLSVEVNTAYRSGGITNGLRSAEQSCRNALSELAATVQ